MNKPATSSRPPSPVIITGGAQRLGLATAIALKEQGYPVVITYRTDRPVLDELRAQGIETIHADFASEDGALQLAQEIGRRFETVRALIHNASEWAAEGEAQNDAKIMQKMLGVHVTAPYLLNQQCGELLLRHGMDYGYADIIHMSDFVATTGSRKHIAYAASKAAIENLSLSYAKKFAPWVKVNSIAPALLMFNQDDDSDYREKARSKSLLGIVPGESEGVTAVKYLLESRYLTGKTLALDGGRHLAQAS